MSGLMLKLPAAQRARLSQQLQRGETVLWVGARRWTTALPAALTHLLFVMVALAFAFVWEAASLGFFWDAWYGPNRSKTPPALAAVMVAFGLPFLLIGLAGLAWPIRVLREARATLYAVTSHRLLTLIGGPGPRVQSVPPQGIRRIERRRVPLIGEWISVTHGAAPQGDDETVASTVLAGLDDAAGAEVALRRLAASR